MNGVSSRPLEHGETPWLLAVALITGSPHAWHLPGWLSALCGGVLGWRLWLWHRRRALPPRWWLALLVAGSTAGIGWQFGTLLGRDAGVALLVVFMALKPLEMARRRDALVVIMLGYFLLLSHYFYSQSIPTGLWLLIAVALLTGTLIRLHGGAQPIVAIARLVGLLLAQALPLMLILYLFFPRISGPLWGLPQDAHSGLSGLSEQMAPGSISRLIQSSAIAFRSRFAGTLPERAALYWRGPVFDDYDGLTWRASTPSAGTPAKSPTIDALGETYAYTTLLEAHNQRWLLALDMPTALPAGAALAPSLQVLSSEPVRARAQFPFVAVLDYRANAMETTDILQKTLSLPANINPRTRALAEQWRSMPPEKIAATALALFEKENFYYTLQPPLLGQDGIDQFLFDTRRGFCEHYASAFVFLMRAAGVPARVVAGYQGGEVNPIDGYLTVRQSDAHAWAEIWLAGRGWQRIDPTAAVAPSRIARGIAAALPDSEPLPPLVRLESDWLREARNRWEAANNRWNQWVLGYNPQRQKEVLSKFGLPHPDWQRMSAVLAGLCGAVLAIVVLWTRPRRRADDPAQRLWKKYCAQLRRLGVNRAPWEGPTAFARRVASEKPSLAALTREAAAHYTALRYDRSDTERPRRLRLLENCLRRLPPSRRNDV